MPPKRDMSRLRLVSLDSRSLFAALGHSSQPGGGKVEWWEFPWGLKSLAESHNVNHKADIVP